MAAHRLVVRLEGRSFEIEVEPNTGGPVSVRVDGVELEVERASGPSWRVKNAGHAAATRVVLDDERRPTEGAVEGERYGLQVLTAAQAALEAALGSQSAGASSGRVEAPMPGRVVKLLVAQGDSVEAGTPVVIVEAMKMENELHAATSGVVKSAVVAAGDTVDAGALLLEIEAHPPS